MKLRTVLLMILVAATPFVACHKKDKNDRNKNAPAGEPEKPKTKEEAKLAVNASASHAKKKEQPSKTTITPAKKTDEKPMTASEEADVADALNDMITGSSDVGSAAKSAETVGNDEEIRNANSEEEAKAIAKLKYNAIPGAVDLAVAIYRYPTYTLNVISWFLAFIL